MLITIPLIWLAVMTLVVAACQVSARADRRMDAELDAWRRFLGSLEPAGQADRPAGQARGDLRGAEAELRSNAEAELLSR
ncbi:MAG: hypothetical protein M3Z95_03085 [Actinomycetota bacterium]|nr:hypothetical protein [Actinomycetota bacterium]